MDGRLLVERLLVYAKTYLHLEDCDTDYMRNVLLSRFSLADPYEGEADFSDIGNMDVPDALVAEIGQRLEEG